MENSFQTSFIPKKLITTDSSKREPRSFFSIITIFLLIASILMSGGLYLYKAYLKTQQESLSSSLTITRDSFEKDTIEELELFNKRTESAKQILSNHIVLSPMFALLGEITIPSIQYTSFEQQTNNKAFFVNIKGIARDYRSIALQAEVFNSTKGRSFKNVLFSDLMKDKNNNVSFNLKFNIEPDLLSYEKNDLPEEINTSTIPPVTTPTTPPVITPITPDVTIPTSTTITPTPDSLSKDLGNQTQ
jgi:hypothetical protein